MAKQTRVQQASVHALSLYSLVLATGLFVFGCDDAEAPPLGNNGPDTGQGGSVGTTGLSGGTATGAAPSGGRTATGGGSTISCSGTMPSGGTQRCSSNASGTAAGLSWSIWSNGS